MENFRPEEVVKKYLGLAGIELFLKIIGQKPENSDAIVFLQGDRFDRINEALDLYNKGFSKNIVITGNNVLIGAGKRADENDVSLDVIKNYFLERGIPESALIIDDKSLNTLDQAINTLKLAKQKKWKSLILVTSPYHVLRAHLTFLKEGSRQSWRGTIIVKAADLEWNQNPSGRGKTALEMLEVEMEKLEKYKLL